jgi:hypothetical protein
MEAAYWSVDMARRCIKKGARDAVFIFVHDAQRPGEQRIIEQYLEAPGIERLSQVRGQYGELASFKVTKAKPEEPEDPEEPEEE